ncbi:uncharacterized protein BYT42DRAFT_609600 [Radiomyces spectabilis]|uniref:uncharacterized protein n=1 Tax=Radiomyces spectabilis TaxID=64574 RepID=UPI002220E7C8|nr:uncharacterized protein BYT42DRAFT_609600 [Radiomyces spectabilis]KAI8393835.1 hypothetical protein BYT42DRAFT_609600 [Radiomyces spectabilis]
MKYGDNQIRVYSPPIITNTNSPRTTHYQRSCSSRPSSKASFNSCSGEASSPRTEISRKTNCSEFINRTWSFFRQHSSAKDPHQLDQHLQAVLYAYRTKAHEVVRVSPIELLFQMLRIREIAPDLFIQIPCLQAGLVYVPSFCAPPTDNVAFNINIPAEHGDIANNAVLTLFSETSDRLGSYENRLNMNTFAKEPPGIPPDLAREQRPHGEVHRQQVAVAREVQVEATIQLTYAVSVDAPHEIRQIFKVGYYTTAYYKQTTALIMKWKGHADSMLERLDPLACFCGSHETTLQALC